MSIIRGPNEASDLYVIDEPIGDGRRLSWAACGLLAYLLGKPDNWRCSVTALVNETAGSSRPTKRDGVYSLLRELESAGHLVRVRAERKESIRPAAAVWSVIRKRVFARDGYVCQYCGVYGGRLECDHVVPVARGGGHDDANLTTACFPCNRSKRDKMLGEWTPPMKRSRLEGCYE